MTFSGRHILLAAIGLVLFVGLSVGAQQVATTYFDFEPADFREWIEGFGIWGPLVYIVVLVASIVFSPLPTAALAVGAGLAYDVVLGSLYTIAGGMIGGLICFELARWLGRPWLERRMSPATMNYIDQLSISLGARLLFVTRLIPVFGFEWVSYAAGLTKIRRSTFVVWSIAGSILPVVAVTYAGDQLEENPLMSVLVLGIFVAVAAAALGYFLVRGRIARRRVRVVSVSRPDEEPAGAARSAPR